MVHLRLESRQELPSLILPPRCIGWWRFAARLRRRIVVPRLRILAPEINPASLAALDVGRVLLAVSTMTAEARPGFESLGGTQPTLDDVDGPALLVGLSGLEQQQLPRRQSHWDGMEAFQVFGDLRIL